MRSKDLEMGALKGGDKRKQTTEILEILDQKLSRCDENYKSTYPSISRN